VRNDLHSHHNAWWHHVLHAHSAICECRDQYMSIIILHLEKSAVVVFEHVYLAIVRTTEFVGVDKF